MTRHEQQSKKREKMLNFFWENNFSKLNHYEFCERRDKNLT